MNRPLAVSALCVLYAVAGAGFLFMQVGDLVGGRGPQGIGPFPWLAVTFASAWLLATGAGAWFARPWARVLAIVFHAVVVLSIGALVVLHVSGASDAGVEFGGWSLALKAAIHVLVGAYWLRAASSRRWFARELGGEHVA